MAVDYFLPLGDTLPDITGTITNADGTPVDLTGATVKLLVLDVTETIVLNKAATVTSAGAGQVSYTPLANDFPAKGDYFARFQSTMGGRVMSDPPDRWLWLVVS